MAPHQRQQICRNTESGKRALSPFLREALGEKTLTSNKSLSNAELCMALMRVDDEAAVINLLSEAGYWKDSTAWRPINDEENNFSTIGNQQSDAIAAFVEKIVNGVDARLLDACLRAGDDPESQTAPQSMREAVVRYFEHRPNPARSRGRISDWSDAEATAQGRLLTVAATGYMPADGRPSLTVADQGEGQTPDSVPGTFMSLQKSNKLRIPFVQGKFNMGGTGALQFCSGQHKLQLIVTRRDPYLLPAGATARDRQWSFTVVRREKPSHGVRSSMYTYLAPVSSYGSTRRGVLSFDADSWPIFPEANDSVRGAYERVAEYGSLVKLYEYEWQGTKSNIVSSGEGLLRRIDVGLPELALPVRLYECRAGYKGGPASFATNAMGLVARLERDRAGNMESASPIGAAITLEGRQISLRIYVFLPGKAKQYRSARQGIVFGINGQTHGTYSIDFFRRKSVGMSYLADSLLVFADCSAIEGQMREDLFMNSRDRLRDNPLSRELESRLESLLKHEPTLRELGNRRRQALLQERLSEDKPLADVLQSLMKTNPMLNKLLVSGMRLSAPFPPSPPNGGNGKGMADKFEGKRYPTFFRFKDKKDGEALQRRAMLGVRSRIAMETDAEDQYFVREDDPGIRAVTATYPDGTTVSADGMWTDPKSGVGQLWVELPEGAKLGEQYDYLIEVVDSSQLEPFSSELVLTVVPKVLGGPGGKPKKPKVYTDGSGGDGGLGGGLALPEVIRVREAEWEKYGFTDESALTVLNSAAEVEIGRVTYDFFVNVDNKYLKIIQKEAPADTDLLENQFTYGLVLVGLALLQDSLRRAKGEADDHEDDIEGLVSRASRAIAPMLLPLIQSIGDLSSEDE
jgi:hypothetical protein